MREWMFDLIDQGGWWLMRIFSDYVRWYDILVMLALGAIGAACFWLGAACGAEIEVPVQGVVVDPKLPVEVYVGTMPGCGPCLQLVPVIRQLRREGYTISEWDVLEHRGLYEAWGLEGTPAILILQDGIELDRRIGFQPLSSLRKWLSSFGLRGKGTVPQAATATLSQEHAASGSNAPTDRRGAGGTAESNSSLGHGERFFRGWRARR